MDHFIIGNMVWSAILIAALGAMIRGWMADTRAKIDQHCETNLREHDKLFHKIDNHESRISKVEVKAGID
ncbi:MAG TPA: hypothetical protein VLH56_16415 [Dissulfurispiraceae bacterium]|nr:hypothetical protein [Dissulfurispiraceae bacterium]